MPERSSYLRDAGIFVAALTLASVASSAALCLLMMADAAISMPNVQVSFGNPMGFIFLFTVVGWILGSLPAAYAFHRRLGLVACSILGFGYTFGVMLLLQLSSGSYAPPWKLLLEFGVSGMAGGAMFAVVARALDKD